MRMMLRIEMDTETTNKAIRQGDMPMIMESLEKQLHPEAVYFTPTDGMRTGYVFFEMKSPDDIPVIAEPLFQQLGAKLHFTPAMTMDEVDRGLKKALKVS